MRIQPYLFFLIVKNYMLDFIQRKWIKHLVASIFLISIGLALYQHRSSYVSVELPNKPGIPPDPGREVNSRTLLGIDSDNDGVRDDVQRYILALDIDHPFFKRALHQYAVTMQTALEEAYIPERAKQNLLLTGRALDCAYAASIEKKYNYTRNLNKIIINTKSRRNAYRNWIKNIPFTMQVASNNAQEYCTFDVNLFEGERWK